MEPTSEQCTAGALLREDEDGRYFATWYPQMGGYVGKAEVRIAKWPQISDACFNVRVWHDGDFPFDADSGRGPCELHHCAPSQFIEFGQKVLALQSPSPSRLVEFTGAIVDMGDLDHGTGLTIKMFGGRQITVTGLTREELIQLRDGFAEEMTITLDGNP